MDTAYLIAYDVVDDKRRSQIASLLLSYGERIQASVYIIGAKSASFVRLKNKLKTIIDTSEDSILIVNMGAYTNHKKVYQTIGVRHDDGLDRDCLVF